MTRPANADTDTDPRTYTVSVTFERFEDGNDGDPAETGFELEKEDFDCEQLQRLSWKYGFNAASDSHLPLFGSHKPWFLSTSPREDRAHFERGEDCFFALHLDQVDGREPTAADLQRVGDYFGVAFANRVEDDDAPAPAKP